MAWPLSIQSGVSYAKSFLPETLVSSLSTIQTSISRHIYPSPPRIFTVYTHDRKKQHDFPASSLDELLKQAAGAFVLCGHLLTLVLDEDGTVCDSEFFSFLPGDTAVMLLQDGERWTHNQISQTHTDGIGNVTFDLYKLHPKDLTCCLSFKASLRDTHSLSIDLRFTTIKHILSLVLPVKSGLRLVSCLNRVSGRLLLHTSSSLQQITGEDDC